MKKKIIKKVTLVFFFFNFITFDIFYAHQKRKGNSI